MLTTAARTGWGCVSLCSLLAAAAEPRLTQGDYEVALTASGLTASFRGTPIVCASHLTVHKPNWQGAYFSALDLAASPTAKTEASATRLRVSDQVRQPPGEVFLELELDAAAGIRVSFGIRFTGELPAGCPVECPLAVFPAATFAGGGYRASGLFGEPDWLPLSPDPPAETGPGTKFITGKLQGLDLRGGQVELSLECEDGPAPALFDMRSRSYPPAEKNFWLLYSWQAQPGETVVRARISARAAAPPPQPVAAGQVFVQAPERAVPVQAIVVAGEAHPITRAAATELQQYLRRLSGQEIPVLNDAPDTVTAPGLICLGVPTEGRPVGRGPVLVTVQDLAGGGYDAFAVRSQAGVVVVAGNGHRAVTYGVYRLLQTLGCRFWARDLEVVPGPGPVTIPDGLALRAGAAFEWRAMSGTIAPLKCSLSPGEWEARVAGVDVPKMMGFPKGGFWHHTMGFLVPAAEAAREHPEYLAMIGNQRPVVEPAVQQYCLANPGLLEAMTAKVLAWIAADPDRDYYPVHYGDVVKFCECAACQALYTEKGSITDTVIWFDNQIARAVAERFPGKFVTILAYHSTRRAPVRIKPEPNLLIIFCAIVECQGRPWTHPVNLKRNVCKDLDDWVAIHPLGAQGIMSFDYPTTYYYAGFPYPALYAYIENLRYYQKVGLRGVYVCGLGGSKHLEHLYSYVIPRIMWDPQQDAGALIAEFCQAWYGPAWEPMRDYVELLHRGAMDSTSDGVMDCHAGPGQRYFRELYTREFLDRGEALFSRALAAAAEPAVRRRIQKEQWGLLFVDLFLHGQAPGDLLPVSTELGVDRRDATLDDCRKLSELLRANRQLSRPWMIEPRRGYSFSNLTGLSPAREPWWTAPEVRELMDAPERAYARRQDFAAVLDRYFVTLDSPFLRLMLIPRLGGRIWRLYDRRSQQDLLWRGPLSIATLDRGVVGGNYTNLGGYEEYASEKFGGPGWSEAYTCERTADDTSVTLAATLANGLRLTRTVRVSVARPEVEVDSLLENASDKPVADVRLRAHPQFRFDSTAAPEFSIQAADGTQPFAAAAGENFLTGDKLPRGAWSAKLAPGGRRLLNEFTPAQVDTCLLYRGPEFINLELFSPRQTLAPGQSLRLQHRYRILAE